MLPTTSVASTTAIPIVPNTVFGIVPGGGAAGGDALYCNLCDLIGPRNLQGGGPGGEPFDIGAGSTADPSDIAFNWDVGRRSKFYDGHKHLVATFGPKGSKFYNPRTGKLLAWFGIRGIRFYVRPKLVH